MKVAIKKLFICCRHLLLLIVYFTYLSVFALLLQLIEKPRQQLMNKRHRLLALQQRHHFIANEILPNLFNNTQLLLFVHAEKSRRIGYLLLKALHRYDKLTGHRWPETEDVFERFDGALMFAFSSSTTLGSPLRFQRSPNLSNYTKIVTICFGLVGILLTLLVVADLATLLRRLLLKQQKMLGPVCRLVLCFVPRRRGVSEMQIVRPEKLTKRQEPSFILLLIIWSIWLYFGHFLMKNVGELNLSTIDLLWWYVHALTTSGITSGVYNLKNSPIFIYLLIPYILFGFCITSLMLNAVFLKICHIRASPTSPPEQYKEEDRKLLMASREDTFSEFDNFDESLIRSYHTVGIFQIESPMPTANPTKHQEVGTQTESFIKEKSRLKATHRYSFAGHTSHDDVQSLLRETYRAKTSDN